MTRPKINSEDLHIWSEEVCVQALRIDTAYRVYRVIVVDMKMFKDRETPSIKSAAFASSRQVCAKIYIL